MYKKGAFSTVKRVNKLKTYFSRLGVGAGSLVSTHEFVTCSNKLTCCKHVFNSFIKLTKPAPSVMGYPCVIVWIPIRKCTKETMEINWCKKPHLLLSFEISQEQTHLLVSFYMHTVGTLAV